MARPVVETGLGIVKELFPPNPDRRGLLTSQLFLLIRSAVVAIQQRVNGRLSLGNTADATRAGNLDAQYRIVTMPATPGDEILVDHGLGRVAVGYDVVEKDMAAHIYSSQRATWNSTVLKLKSDVASVTVRLRVY